MNAQKAIECIKGVADMLGFSVQILLQGEASEHHSINEKVKSKRALFSINGGEPACKNRTVLNTVRLILKEFPSATFKEICDFFPKHLQGSYGVVTPCNNIEMRKLRNNTEESRWFLDTSEILTSADKIRFAVCSEWGDNFDTFCKHVEKEFAWTIKEV